tara:strand:- start:504 stop:1307 length:804 start_codon:yes stop_codon:yes gene_type:complete
MMDKINVDRVIHFAKENNIKTVDLTGGAPEINKYFTYLIESCTRNGIHVIDRCNLTILNEKGMESLPIFLADNKVEIIASLPCYKEQNVNKQRGKGVFESSIAALKKLNALGYGSSNQLTVNLVYNPQGAELPPDQQKLEKEYKLFLNESFGIKFNNLYTITNMPINRFGSTLVSKNLFKDYMKLLKHSFSEKARENVMCKTMISVDPYGYVYDCDFNQMLNIPLSNNRIHISEVNQHYLRKRQIATADHCFGCTAGSGSSCGGSLV